MWAVIGVSAAIELSIREDFALGIAVVIALAAFAGKPKVPGKFDSLKANKLLVLTRE